MMDKIVLNGSKYISETKVLEMLKEVEVKANDSLIMQIRKEERDKLKTSLIESFDSIFNVIDDTQIQKTEPKIVQEVSRYNTNGNSIYIVLKSMRREYSRLYLQEDGTFLTNRNKSPKFTIHTILGIKNRLNLKSTVDEVNNVATSLNIPSYTIGRLFYNVHQLGTFDKFLQEWEDLQAAEFFKSYKKLETEPINNPEKRKEAGLYS